MSGIALIWAANVKGLQPAAKVVLIQLADFHNKETGQCNPSAQRLADECEMSRATVFRHMKDLEALGLVTRHPNGDGQGGRSSNQYDLHIDVALGPSARKDRMRQRKTRVESQNETGVESQIGGGLSRTGETGVVSNCDTNLTNEPGKNLTPIPPEGGLFSGELEKGDEADKRAKADADFGRFWAVYPKKAGKPSARKAWDKAIKRADPDMIIEGARAYAHWLQNAAPGEFRPHVKHPQGWLNDDRWTEHAGQAETYSFAALSLFERQLLEKGICPPSMKQADGKPTEEAAFHLRRFGRGDAA